MFLAPRNLIDGKTNILARRLYKPAKTPEQPSEIIMQSTIIFFVFSVSLASGALYSDVTSSEVTTTEVAIRAKRQCGGMGGCCGGMSGCGCGSMGMCGQVRLRGGYVENHVDFRIGREIWVRA